jgi:hypothetical protein
MDMDSAAVFLAGSILYAVGFIVILIAVVVVNNIIFKYWKSFGWNIWSNWFVQPSRFASQEELDRIAPTLDHPEKPTKNK